MNSVISPARNLCPAYSVTDAPDIILSDKSISNTELLRAVQTVNDALISANAPFDGIALQLYDIMDLRMLSGLVGEMFVGTMCDLYPFFRKNPNIDGYPDLMDISTVEAKRFADSATMDSFLKFPYGGLEVKNTFGLKKAKTDIPLRESRISRIQSKLVWKAHHRETNHLLALQSDYVDRIPQIVAIFYSDDLCETDWTVKQQPREGSTMTSFCQTERSAFNKLRQGLRLYRQGMGLERFLGISP